MAAREVEALQHKWDRTNEYHKISATPTLVVMKAWEKPGSVNEKKRRKRSLKRNSSMHQCNSDLHAEGNF